MAEHPERGMAIALMLSCRGRNELLLKARKTLREKVDIVTPAAYYDRDTKWMAATCARTKFTGELEVKDCALQVIVLLPELFSDLYKASNAKTSPLKSDISFQSHFSGPLLPVFRPPVSANLLCTHSCSSADVQRPSVIAIHHTWCSWIETKNIANDSRACRVD